MNPFFTVTCTTEYIVKWALIYRVAGISVFELKVDGTGKPKFDWKPFQYRLATGREIAERFGNAPCGIGLVTGRISRLEVLTFRDRPLLDSVDKILSDITSCLPVIRTPQGPYLIYYRTDEPTESEVLARDPVTKESRISKAGEGSFVVAIPGSEAVHQEIVSYEQIRGPVLPDFPTLAARERRQLLDACRRL